MFENVTTALITLSVLSLYFNATPSQPPRVFEQAQLSNAQTSLSRSTRTRATNTRYLNDIHSKLNRTEVLTIHTPKTLSEIQQIVKDAKASGESISISGGKHAMGGQQFGKKTTHICMTAFNRVLNFDAKNGLIEVQAGIQWPKLIKYLWKHQQNSEHPWGITQKQTGADRLTIGGALSANIHGRGLTFRPFISDVESLIIIDPDGNLKTCSRQENSELFRLVVGGYGLFGVITSAKIRLSPRIKLRRDVQLATIDELPALFAQRIREGYLYGDFQFSTNEQSPEYLEEGVFATYKPVAASTPLLENQKKISIAEWTKLYEWAHFDKEKAFEAYSHYYLSTSGQIYWSDKHQLSDYIDNYHDQIDEIDPCQCVASEMITEVYVPLEKLPEFMKALKKSFLRQKTNVFYGTVRLIKKDEESFLAWAKQNYVCIIFNLHVQHTPESIKAAKAAFRKIINKALSFGGSYYLTYHRWATKTQVLKAYPEFVEFLRLKQNYDPASVFESDWYRRYCTMFAKELSIDA